MKLRVTIVSYAVGIVLCALMSSGCAIIPMNIRDHRVASVSVFPRVEYKPSVSLNNLSLETVSKYFRHSGEKYHQQEVLLELRSAFISSGMFSNVTSQDATADYSVHLKQTMELEDGFGNFGLTWLSLGLIPHSGKWTQKYVAYIKDNKTEQVTTATVRETGAYWFGIVHSTIGVWQLFQLFRGEEDSVQKDLWRSLPIAVHKK